MNRAETTRFLGELLKSDRFRGMGKYWASEVSVDAFTTAGKGGRVDFMQFEPPNQYAVSALEKGIFICYEVKSCKEDVYSGNGLNFYGEKNYIVTTMQCYKDILPDLQDGTFDKHLRKTNQDSSAHYGIMVAVPVMRVIVRWKNLPPTRMPRSRDYFCGCRIRWGLNIFILLMKKKFGSR